MTDDKGNSKPGASAQKSMRSVEKALGLLRHFSLSTPEFGLSDLARAAKLDKATTLRCLTALERQGFVEQDPESRRYRLGLTLLQLARIREATFPFTALVRPELERLVQETGETAHVSAQSGADLVTIAVLEPKRTVRVSLDMDEVISVHAAASGLVLLAFGNGLKVEDLPERLKAFTSTTLSTRSALRAAVEKVAAEGYATAPQSFEEDVTGIAAPIFDRSGVAVAAVGVASVSTRQTEASVAATRDAVLASARRLSDQIARTPMQRAAE